MKQTYLKILYFILFGLSVILLFLVETRYEANPSCTIFTAAQGETVLFGNNEDWHSPTPIIGFFQATSERFGSVHVGTRHTDGSNFFEGAMNDQGLAWDVNSLPNSKLNPHPEKPYSHATDNYLSTITQKAATVEEAIRIADEFDFGDSMAFQIHIGDASGDAAVISAGPDGEVAITRKEVGDGYIVSTNFNLANPENGTQGWRYETAVSMLGELGESQALTADFAADVLDAVHLNNLTTYTLYSNIFDLTNQKIYLYYMSQYSEGVELNLAEELTKGERTVSMANFFSPETVEAGNSAYQRFETRFTAAKVAFILLILVLLSVGVVFVVRRYRRRRKQDIYGGVAVHPHG